MVHQNGRIVRTKKARAMAGGGGLRWQDTVKRDGDALTGVAGVDPSTEAAFCFLRIRCKSVPEATVVTGAPGHNVVLHDVISLL